MKKRFIGFVSTLASAFLATFFVGITVYAATTISTDILTGGTLTVSGVSYLNGGATTTQLSATRMYVGQISTTTISGDAGTSTFSGRISATALTIGSASSTFGNGINLTAGCFAIGGVCVASATSGAVTAVSNADGTLTVTPTTGAVVASLNLAHVNSWTAPQIFVATTTFLNTITFGGGYGIDTSSAVPLYFGTTTASAITIGRSAITTTMPGPLSVKMLSVTGTTASSTFANGIDLTAGCFSISGVCISGSSTGASLTGTNAWTGSNTFSSATTTFVNGVANGSLFSLALDTLGANPLYIGTSSANAITIGKSAATTTFPGNVAISRFTVTSSVASSTFANGINLTSGCFSVLGTCITAGATLSAGGTGAVQFANGSSFDGLPTKFYWDNTNYRLGIGTTSPYATLSVVGQIVGSYFSATSTTATSTLSGGLSVGSTGQSRALAVLGIGTSTFANGISLSSGCFSIAGTCISGSSTGAALNVQNSWTVQQNFQDLTVQPGTIGVDTFGPGMLKLGTASATAITIGSAAATTTLGGAVMANGAIVFGGNATVTPAGAISTNGALTLANSSTAINGIVFGTCSWSGSANISTSTPYELFDCTGAAGVTNQHKVFVQDPGSLPPGVVVLQASSTVSSTISVRIGNYSSAPAIFSSFVLNFMGIR